MGGTYHTTLIETTLHFTKVSRRGVGTLALDDISPPLPLYKTALDCHKIMETHVSTFNIERQESTRRKIIYGLFLATFI